MTLASARPPPHDLVGRRSSARGRARSEIVTSRVDEDIRLLRPQLQVHTLETERIECVEQPLATTGPFPLLRNVDLRHEVLAICSGSKMRLRVNSANGMPLTRATMIAARL